MSKLANLIEQTTYLLSKQQEAQKETAAVFEDVLALVEKEAASKPEVQRERLMEVYEALSQRAESLSNYAQEDIDFLQDQLKALNAVKEVKDPAIAAEMLQSIIDDEEELPTFAEFKESIDEELEQSKILMTSVVDDIKDALERNDIRETELLIETLLEEMEEDEDFDFDDEDDDDFDDEDEDEDDRPRKKGKSGCGDCSGGCGPKGCSGCPVNGGDSDIFSFLSKYDRDLQDDMSDEDEEGDDCCSDDEGCDDEDDAGCCGGK